MDEEVHRFDACYRDLIARLRVVVFFFRIYFVVVFSNLQDRGFLTKVTG